MVRAVLPIVVDVICVVAFAIGGKDAHDAHASWWVVAAIVWPYLVGLGLGWVAAIWNGMRGLKVWPGGVLILALTYVVGMVLRVIAGRGIEPSFLLVAGIFLTVTMLGWRGLWKVVGR